MKFHTVKINYNTLFLEHEYDNSERGQVKNRVEIWGQVTKNCK